MTTATTHEFSLILSGTPEMTDGVADALYGTGCDDALVSVQCGVPYVDFDRDAESFEEAVLTAIRDVERAGVQVLRVEPDDLVSASEIARRTERTRESIRLLAQGERGRGGFPPPISGVLTKAPMWRWSEVARWFAEEEDQDSEAVRNATAIATINNVLDLRLHQIPKSTVDGLWRQLQRCGGKRGERKGTAVAGSGGAAVRVATTTKKKKVAATKKAKTSTIAKRSKKQSSSWKGRRR